MSQTLQKKCKLLYGLVFLLLLFMGNLSHAQGQVKKTITGKVTDSLGIGLPGVVVAAVNQANVGTQTDNNGKFVLDVSPGQ
ncbi:MAG: hypothetical protein EOO95_17230, partial [Pedobacter sp.]